MGILFWYLIEARYSDYREQAIFLVPLIFALLVIAYQIVEFKEGSSARIVPFFLVVTILKSIGKQLV